MFDRCKQARWISGNSNFEDVGEREEINAAGGLILEPGRKIAMNERASIKSFLYGIEVSPLEMYRQRIVATRRVRRDKGLPEIRVRRRGKAEKDF